MLASKWHETDYGSTVPGMMEAQRVVEEHSALFLDRDGVIIENRLQYVRTWRDVKLIPESVLAGRQISQAGYPIVVVTNQAGVGRGVLKLNNAQDINNRLVKILRSAGVNVIDAYMCPHHPDEDCICRKPKPGMLLKAAHDHKIDLRKSVLVGDSLRDLQAADAVGTKGKLVRTGMGSEQEAEVMKLGGDRWPVFDNLLEAVPSILSDLRTASK